MSFESGQSGSGGLGSDGCEQTAGRLRIEKQSAEFFGDAGRMHRDLLDDAASQYLPRLLPK